MNQSSEFLLQWNTRSLLPVPHWGEFKNYMLNKKPLVAAIQETHFIDSDAINYNYNIKGYSLYTDNVNETPRRGGSALYISNKLLHHQIPLRTTLNAVGAKIKIAQLDLTVVSLYLSPTTPVPPVSQLLSQLPTPFLVLGDFNAHHRTWGCHNTYTRGTQLLNILDDLDLTHLSTLTPTHITTQNGEVTHSVIDLAITDPRTATLYTQQVADDPLFSDHYPIHYNLEVPSGQTNFNFLPRWNFKKADWTAYQNHINFSLDIPPPDINSFLNIILAAAHQTIPHTHPPRENRNAPWWNTECQRAVALRRRALKKFKRCICRVHDEEARTASSEASEIIQKAKIEGWQSFSNGFNRFTSLSKIWTMIKCFSNKRTPLYKIPHLQINDHDYLLPNEVASQFAQHYAHISSAQQYTQAQTTALDTTLATLSFHSDNTEQYNAPFTHSELTHAIHKCGNTSVGPDQVAYPFFKNLPESGLNALLDTLNHLWDNNSYPTDWRSSTLIPILKPRKPPSDPASYRPISLTSCASKLMERIINGRIRVHLESNNLLSSNQNGFRPGRSTANGLVHLIDSIQKGFHTNSHTMAVFLDLKNAFDKVNKSALLIKIHRIGIRGRTAYFIKEFLKDRTFRVRCGNTYSDIHNQDHGLPQGSVISPTLFLIMINDIFDQITTDVQFSLYADDVAFWVTRYDAHIAHQIIQETLNQINNWCREWGLTPSPTKSASIIFTPPRTQYLTPPRLTLNNQVIAYEKHYKYLGITLDCNLSFTKHFNDIKQRCARRINILKCISGKDWGSDRATLLRLYTSLIRPILDYNAFLFDDIASEKIDSLQIIQNSALRIVTGALRTSPIFNLHIDTNIPLLDRRRKYQLLRFYARAMTRPNEPLAQILDNPPRNHILTDIQRKYPIIAQRIQKMKVHFQVENFKVLPIPPLLYSTPNINIEYLQDGKHNITRFETLSRFYEYKTNHKDFTFLYTDGSRADGRTGVGFFAPSYHLSKRISDIHSVYTAELLAILYATKYIKTKRLKQIVICSDSKSSLTAIGSTTHTNNYLVYLIRNNLKVLQQASQIKLLWVPAHTGIPGNEEADRLARLSLQQPPNNDILSPISDVFNHLHEKLLALRQFDWDANPHHHLHAIKPHIGHFSSSHQNTRLKETVLAKLRIGHTKLTHTHYFRNPKDPIPCYKCGNPNIIYTIPHFLLHCPHLQIHRQPILQYLQRQNLPLDLPTLLGDNNPDLIELLFNFLHDARIIDNI